MRADVHEPLLPHHSHRLLGTRNDFCLFASLYCPNLYQVFNFTIVLIIFHSLVLDLFFSHKTEKVEKARKYLAKEKKKHIEQEKKRIEADRKTLARKRNIYEAWLAPDGKELTNQQVEDLLSAKEAELDKQEEDQVSHLFLQFNGFL